jgi:PTH1 family peptidyl-tRNA hydrolase
MHLIVGLGNPGEKFADTRHNMGFTVLEACVGKFQTSEKLQFEDSKKLKSEILKLGEYVFAKPTTFMNLSGDAVKLLTDLYKVKLPDLWIIHDDLDIKFGSYKIQFGIGPKVHNGLLSIYEKLGTKNFWHVRVGIENREKGLEKISGEQFVLRQFTEDETEIRNRVISQVVDDLVAKLKTTYE